MEEQDEGRRDAKAGSKKPLDWLVCRRWLFVSPCHPHTASNSHSSDAALRNTWMDIGEPQGDSSIYIHLSLVGWECEQNLNL